jgi:ribonuclease J
MNTQQHNNTHPPRRHSGRPFNRFAPKTTLRKDATERPAPATVANPATQPRRDSFNNKRSSPPPRLPKKAFSESTSEAEKERKAIARKKRLADIPPLAKDTIRIIPLGGVEEIGRNMTMVEINDQIIVIDAGIGFSDEETPGIDYMIPNTTYLEENVHKIKALVITHGHLDHIGGIPYLYNRIGRPKIYTREFGALLIKSKCAEFPGVNPTIVTVEASDGALPISEDFKVRFFGLTHSIPDSTGVIIETPFGDIVSTGDVRVDNIDGVPMQKEYEQYGFFKDRNVLLMTMDSTGIPYPGWSLSESQVVETIDGIIKDCPGRLIIGTFASQVERIIEFVNSAKKYGKYVVVEGRSMKTNIGIAEELKLTDFSHIIPIEEMDNYPPHKIMVLATGAQGEEFAALMRVSNRTHKFIRLTPQDTIVLSSSVIPGNESAVDKLKDNLYRTDSKVITYMDNVVHASGHGKRGELEWIHQQVPYKFFMPVHGHHHRLKMHAELAESLGAKKENLIVPDNGSIIEIRNNGTTIVKTDKKVPGDPLIIDGFSISDSQHLVLRDRKLLAQDGIFVIVAMVDLKTRKLKKSPDLISRGFIYLKENQELLQKTRILIKKTIEDSIATMNPVNFDTVKDTVNKKIGKFLLQNTAKNPVVIPVILSV